MMPKGSELEGYEKYTCWATKMHSIRKDQVYKPKLRSVISNLVASEIRSSHCYSLTTVAMI